MTDPSTRDRLLQDLLPALQKNCCISDATHSGYYSVCGLFLRLKDQHLWERGLPPWTETDKEALLEWIEAKENRWLEHLDQPFEDLRPGGFRIDYLDTRRMNAILLPHGLYYGAGYGRGFKPTFFLGKVAETRNLQGFTIVVLDEEYASDLVVTPAVRRGRWIILRLTPLRFLLWGKIQEIEHLEREATSTALGYYGWDPKQPPKDQLERMVRVEMETILHHELGEARDRSLPLTLWGRLLNQFPHSRIEIYLRSLKDLLGDTHPAGTLRHIIQNRKFGSFPFYVSNLKGMARLLAPEWIETFYGFRQKADWDAVEHTRRIVRRRLLTAARRIRDLAAEKLPEQPERFQQTFESEFLKPLKI